MDAPILVSMGSAHLEKRYLEGSVDPCDANPLLSPVSTYLPSPLGPRSTVLIGQVKNALLPERLDYFEQGPSYYSC